MTVEPTPATNTTPDSALTPAASDLLQPPPAMTVEQAQAKKASLFQLAGFAERVARGDPEASKLWRAVTRALRPAVDESSVAGKQYAANMDSLAIYRARADISDEALAWVASEGPVSPAEKEKAIFAKQRCLKDAAFVKRLLDGDRAANSEWALINMTLGSRTGTFQEIESHKPVVAKLLAGSK